MHVEEAIRPVTRSVQEPADLDGQSSIADGAVRQFVRFSDAFVSKYNPRPAHEVGDLTELAASLKAVGCLQEPLARPVDIDGATKYEVIFGQRRFRAGEIAFAEKGGMFMKVKPMSDEQALLAGLVENTEHRPMTPVDEARAAASALGMFNGDRTEAAARLGWKPAVLASRLKLMACSETVLDRLSTDPKFPMSIAELLAGLKSADQDEMLVKYDEMGQPTVESFKQVLMQAARKLSAGIFDKEACAGCPNNSAVQRALFDAGLDDGHCMNATCYESKTEAEINRRVADLQPLYQTVRIIRPGESQTFSKLMADGPAPVGEEQFNACRGCASYGAFISALPDSMGRRGTSICFDTVCHKEKVAAYKQHLIDLEQEARADAGSSDEEGQDGSDSSSAQPSSNGSSSSAPIKGVAKGAAKGTGKAKGKAKAAPAVTVTMTGPVKEYRDALYRTVIAKELAKEPLRGLGLLAAMAGCHRLSAIDSTKALALLKQATPEGDNLTTSGLAKSFAAAIAMEGRALGRYVSVLSHLAVDSLQSNELVDLVAVLEPDWHEHFKLDKSFLDKLTKNEMHALAQEVGLDKALGDEFAAIWKLKVAEIHEKLTGVSTFNYNGAIPRVLLPGCGKA